MVLNNTIKDLDKYIDKNNLPINLEIILRPENLDQIYLSSFLCCNLTDPEKCIETFLE